MLRTYSRKARTAKFSDLAKDKSSQDNFFDSPNDPYFFDSQTSTTEDTQLQDSTLPAILDSAAANPPASQSHTASSQPTVPPAAHRNSAASRLSASSNVSQLSVPSAAQLPQLPAKRKSRLSQSSSQPLDAEHVASVKADAIPVHRHSLSQPTHINNVCKSQLQTSQDSRISGEALHKRQCLKRVSSGSTYRSRGSSGKTGTSVPKTPAAPAVTVLEAQESGEHTQIVDDIVYALDGLGTRCSKTSWQDSSSTLAQICASRRGKQAFRVEGLFEETMTAALGLPLEQDPATALAFAAMLLAFACGDVANRALLAQTKAVQLAGKLLKVHRTCNNSTPAEVKLKKLFKQGVLQTAMAGHCVTTPSSVITRALCVTLKPDKTSAASEALKESLRTEGALLELVQAVQYHAEQSMPAATSSVQAPGEGLCAISQCLTALEHASFACAGNEQYLVGLPMPSLGSSSSQQATTQPASDNSKPQPVSQSGESFPAYLTQLMICSANSAKPASDGEHSRTQLHGNAAELFTQTGLSVLVNMTHHNPSGCEAVVNAGGLEMAVGVLSACLQPVEAGHCSPDVDCEVSYDGQSPQSITQDRQHAVAHVGTLTAALGVLINLLESSDKERAALKHVQAPDNSSSVLQMLCRLMQASAANSVSPSGSQQSGAEVTEQHIIDSEDSGHASIIEVYSALLLGFLLSGDQSLQAEVSSSLGSLEPVTASIKKCLSFYVDAGALTSQSEESLRKLLTDLCDSNPPDF